MIQIKNTLFRNLNTICQEHFIKLQPNLSAKLSFLGTRQKAFVTQHLHRIITAKPDDLAQVYTEYKIFCTAQGKGQIKHINRRLLSVFDYKWFTKTNATYYNGYDLAKELNVKTCPYCNRNYTVTVTTTKKNVTRADFDHFFPLKQFPLLALSFYNLVPSCLVCNRSVKNQAKITYGQYVHPYEEGFGNTLKINFFPNDTDSAVGIKTDFEILTIVNPLEPLKSNKCLNNFELFKLKEIYKESHGGEIADLIRKHVVSSGKYLNTLQKAFPALGNADELYRIVFGTYFSEDDHDKRPLSKLTKDVVEQLMFELPLSYNIF